LFQRLKKKRCVMGGQERSLKNGSGGGQVVVVDWAEKKRPEDEVDGSEYQCGLGPFRPSWIQPFASKQAFVVIFCLTWVLQVTNHLHSNF
jgi:hypothetical protein